MFHEEEERRKREKRERKTERERKRRKRALSQIGGYPRGTLVVLSYRWLYQNTLLDFLINFQ